MLNFKFFLAFLNANQMTGKLIFIQDSVVRSMKGRENMSLRDLARSNRALRVVVESPVNERSDYF